jgi:DNA-binding transcriptional ArsR family regulator
VIVGVKRQPQAAFARDPERARRVSEVLKAVAHPLRIRIVAILAEGDENVTALAEKLEAPQAIVSQQLRILRSQGLVDAVRENGFARYRLVQASLRTLVACMESCGR